ncbi:MAG: hypothetical protein HYS65_14315 [Betaproteobacteria bacterium]|nr:hypothetical protein [Betaproteobacteria bacterium]MBI2225337.1 hypothetical protein [Betaproteobacteria bacterium]MBI2288983.1 hypothetical protein [Betaproteobacteria bacterium]MBI3053591.1 hypothetical protein [Betaproteobacteria bacterium]
MNEMANPARNTRPARKTGPVAGTDGRRTAKVEVSISQERVPLLPHERDESADSQSSEPSDVMRQAAADLKRGLQDTDRGPKMNRLAKKLKRRPG